MLPILVLWAVVLLSALVVASSAWRLTRAINREAQRRWAACPAQSVRSYYNCRCVAGPLTEPEPEPIPDTLRDGEPLADVSAAGPGSTTEDPAEKWRKRRERLEPFLTRPRSRGRLPELPQPSTSGGES